MKIPLQKETGNGIVELLLFAPLAMLFLFVGIDAGLAYSERAAITNAVRAGLNTQTVSTSNAGLLRFRDGEYVLDEAIAARLVDEMAWAISQNILRAQGLSTETNPSHFQVRTYLVRIDIDPEHGQFLGQQVVHSADFPPQGSLNIDSLAPDTGRETLQQFLVRTLEMSSSQEPSGFSVPLSPVFLRNSPNVPQSRYLPSSYALVAEVNALMRGISPSVTANLLQGLYAHREHQITLLRTQIG